MKTTPKTFLIAVSCAGFALSAYCLSIGPVFRLAVDTRFEQIAESFYGPVLALADTAMKPVLVSYLRLWDLYHPLGEARTPTPGPE
jgi:hypothetical protein